MFDITSNNLVDLISKGESELVEFKESFGEKVLETLSSFSNSRGGTIFIGVTDTGEICGANVGKKTLEDISNRIQESTDPRVQPFLSVVKHEKKSIIVIKVEAGSGSPVSVRGRYFRRSGRTNQRMSHEEIMQRMISSTGASWDSVLEFKSSLDNLDQGMIQRFVDAVKRSGRRPIPEQSSNYEFLRKIGLIEGDVPTRAALLLFGKDPESYFSSAYIKMGRFRSTTLIVDDREVHGSLILQLDEVMNWFRERLETEFVISGKPDRDVVWEYPLGAIREAVTNLLCHRDYTGLAHSQIRLYDDRVEFWNAGGLPPSLTPDLLLEDHDSMPRNRKIADAFFYAGYIERWGSGTTRMVEELRTARMPVPKFLSEPGKFRLTFYKHPFSDDYLKRKEISKRQILAIEYVKKHGSISNAEYQEIASISKRTASRDLNELIRKGILSIEGTKGRGTIYKIKSN